MRDAWLDLYISDILDKQIHRNGIKIRWWKWW